MTIRTATAPDCEVLLGLIGRLAEYERLADQLAVTADALRQHLFGPEPYAHALLAEDGGRPAGYALYFTTYSTFLGRPGVYLEDLFVVPELRGSGIGRALLASVAAECIRIGGGRLEWAVLDWNRPAIDFYEKLGAGPNASWITYRLAGAELGDLAASAPDNMAP